MLHILWLLLKILLYIIGFILGLFLLILMLLLFCPIRYRGSIKKETSSFRETEGHGKISWLFGLISLRGQLKEAKFSGELYILGIPLFRFLRFIRGVRTKKKTTSAEQITENFDSNEEIFIDTTEENIFSDKSKKADEDANEEEEALLEIKENGERFFYRMGYKIRLFLEKLKKIYQKLTGIPVTARKISLTIKKSCGKIEWWKTFLEQPRTQAAIQLLKQSAGNLIRHVLPTRIQGSVIFGLSDPAITGSVLALLGMTIPFHKNCISVTPVFEDKNIIEGNISLKGRIYGIILLKTAVQLYFNKNIKYVIKRWKHK